MISENGSVDYAAVLADLEAKRAQIEAAIAGIRTLLGQNPLESGSPMPGGGALPTEIQPDTFFGLSIPDATKKFLAMRKRVATTPEIVSALKRGGQPNANSDGFTNTVGSVLARAYANGAGVVRVSRGTWGLAEWYPNKPRKPASKSADDSEDGGEGEA